MPVEAPPPAARPTPAWSVEARGSGADAGSKGPSPGPAGHAVHGLQPPRPPRKPAGRARKPPIPPLPPLAIPDPSAAARDTAGGQSPAREGRGETRQRSG